MLNMKKKLTAATIAGTVGLSALMLGATSPASAMPKEEFKLVCGWAGGVYQSMGKGACTFPNGVTLVNDINEP